MPVTIAIASVEDVLPIIQSLEEFRGAEPHLPETYLQTIGGKNHLILLASYEGMAAGFLIAYDRDSDGSLYCWRVGVLPKFRRKGILKATMEFTEHWAKEHGYGMLKLVTRNSRREMLAFLVNDGFLFTEIIPKETLEDYRIRAQKAL